MSTVATRLVVLCLICSAALLRLYDLGGRSFDSQEIAQLNAVADTMHAVAPPPPTGLNPSTPVSARITALTLWWSFAEAPVRLAGAVAGTATVLAIWLVGRSLVGGEAALYAAALLAYAPLHIAESRHVGPDPWFTLLALLTIAAFCWSLEPPRRVQRSIIFGVVALLACLSSHAAPLLMLALVASALCIAVRDGNARVAVFRILPVLAPAVAAAIWIVRQPLPVTPSFFEMPMGSLLLQAVAALASGGTAAWLAGWTLLLCVVVGAASTARTIPGIVLSLFTMIAIAGVVAASKWWQFSLAGADVGFVLPAYLLLAGSGLSAGRSVMSKRLHLRLAAALQLALVVGIALIELRLRGQVQQPGTAWREAARIVAANVEPDQLIVALQDRASFVFYAPELDARVEAAVRPALAPGYFVRGERGWLIAPAELHAYAGWSQISRWLERFPPVNVSPDPTIDVFYMGRGEHIQLWFEAAFFDLPTCTLVHGDLLFRFLQILGPIEPLLWKVDQIALSREKLDWRNPELLNAVYYLAEHEHADRAASLAYRLATVAPDWDAAQRALAAFRPRAAGSANF